MLYKLTIKEDAAVDIDKAFDYYTAVQHSLAQRFLSDLEDCIFDISANPDNYSYYLSQKRFRSHSLQKFPYSLVYEVINDEVIVYSLRHWQQNPESLFKRLP